MLLPEMEQATGCSHGFRKTSHDTPKSSAHDEGMIGSVVVKLRLH
jgi:hypothetical protein